MDPFPADIDSTDRAILRATYEVVRERGYPETSMRHIADEVGMSKSLLYYHFDDKESLFAAFLDHLLDSLAARLDIERADMTPREELRALLDRLLPREMGRSEREFNLVILEIRTQAPHVDAYREAFHENDRLVRTALTGALERGADEGVFEVANPERTAAFIQAAVLGAVAQGVTLDDERAARRHREALDAYLDAVLSA